MKRLFGHLCLAAAALGTVMVVGGLATIVANNLQRSDSPLRLAGIDFPKLGLILVGIVVLILIGRALLGAARSWLKYYGGFLCVAGLFIGIVHTLVPVSTRVDIQAFLSVQVYTIWIAAALFVIGAILYGAVKNKKA